MFALSDIGLCRQLLIVFSLLVIYSRAYIIDDADPRVTYTSTQGLAPWASLSVTSGSYLTSANGSRVDMDFSRFYNGTLSFANCNVTSQCQISMPFNGSGITVHGVLFAGVSNFTVTVDGQLAPPPSLNPPTPEISPPIYNVTLYNYQSLTLGSHQLVITIVSWQLGESEIALDYVDVNEAPPSPPMSTQASSVPGPSTTMPATPVPVYSGSTWSAYPKPVSAAAHSKGVTIGAAVGGTVGGLVVIASIAALAMICLRRQRQRQIRSPLQPQTGDQSKHMSYFSGPPSPHSHEPYMAYSPYSIHTTAAPTPNLPQL